MKSVLSIAKAKLQYSKGLNQLCAYLTPSEIHALIDDGFEPTKSHAGSIPDKHTAQPQPRWFYFQVKRGEFFE